MKLVSIPVTRILRTDSWLRDDKFPVANFTRCLTSLRESCILYYVAVVGHRDPDECSAQVHNKARDLLLFLPLVDLVPILVKLRPQKLGLYHTARGIAEVGLDVEPLVGAIARLEPREHPAVALAVEAVWT